MSWLDVFSPFGRNDETWIAARYEHDITGFAEPVASGGNPLPAFEDNPLTFWISPEKGPEVRENAFIGCAFLQPVHVRRILIEQTTNAPFRQDQVRIQRSTDGGTTWMDAPKSPARAQDQVSDIRLGRSEPARHWRLVAAGYNAKTSEHAWTPIRIKMMAAFSYRETIKRLGVLRSNPAASLSAAVPEIGLVEFVSPVHDAPPSIAAAAPPEPAAPSASTGLKNTSKQNTKTARPSSMSTSSFDRIAANEMLADGRTQALIMLCDQRAEALPDDPEPCLLGGHAARQQGDLERALRFWSEAYRRDPANDEIACALLSGLHETDQTDSEMYLSLIDRLRVDRHRLTFDYDGIDVNEAAQIYRRYGCVLVRGLLSPDSIELYRERMEHVVSSVPSSLIPLPNSAAYPLNAALCDPDDTSLYERWRDANDHNLLTDESYYTETESARARELASQILRPPIDGLVNQFLAAQHTFTPSFSMARVTRTPSHVFSVTGHQDARLQRNHNLFSTVWIPFTQCGPSISATLGVLPVRLNNYLPTDNCNTSLIDREFLPNDLFFDPEFEPGDALFHSTHSFHRTIMMQDSKLRMSVDLRFHRAPE